MSNAGLVEINLPFKPPTPQNGQTHSNILSAVADEVFECVWSFCGIGT